MVFKTFSEKMQKLIEQKGFIEPTLPQKLGIPEIAGNNNVLIIAPTGIGKTETAMLPLLDKIYTEKRKIKANIPPIIDWIENWENLVPPK